MIIDYTHPEYRIKWNRCGNNKYNGAFYYSKEIRKNIIPNVDTDRNWITVNIPGYAADHSIVFIHNNLHPENYAWLKKYDDLVLVCGVKETMDKVKHLGQPVYLPLSVDVEYVKAFKTEKTRDAVFMGRPGKRRLPGVKLPPYLPRIEGVKRQRALKALAKFKKAYAVGRSAIEAKVLDCEVLPYDPRYPDPSIWQVLDNRDAAKILQAELDKIDKPAEDTKGPDITWTKKELIAYAKAHGIAVDVKQKKTEILKAIKDD